MELKHCCVEFLLFIEKLSFYKPPVQGSQPIISDFQIIFCTDYGTEIM